MENKHIAEISRAKQALEKAKSIPEILNVKQVGEAIQYYAKKKKLSFDIQKEANEFIIDAEIKLGESLSNMEKNKGMKGKVFTGSKTEPLKDNTPTLSDIGISKKESSESQYLSRNADKVKEVIDKKVSAGILPTKSEVINELKKEEKAAAKEERLKHAATIKKANNKYIKALSKGWHKVGNQHLYYGSNLDSEFIDYIPQVSLCFADPPYNAGVDKWDSGFKWEQDKFIDKCKVFAITPGGWNAFNFYKETNMPYIWETVCYIKNGMTHGKCGYANFIKTSIFSKYKVKIAKDLFEITIKVNETEDTSHKGRKPYDYMSEVIDMFSIKGDSIIDLFAGSGTTLLLSEKMGRVSYNAEIDEKYCIDIINRGIENGLKFQK